MSGVGRTAQVEGPPGRPPSLGFTVGRNGRVYPWKFDHDEARARRSVGESYPRIAAALGVSPLAVARVCDDKLRDRMKEATRACYAATCEVCGDPCVSHRHTAKRQRAGYDGRDLCHVCRHRELCVSLRYDSRTGRLLAVRCQNTNCVTGERWQTPGNFGRGKRYPDVREGGFHNLCRACAIVVRRDYRNRNKVPCEGGCGRMVEGKGRANTRSSTKGRRNLFPDRPYLCGRCWWETPEGQAAKDANRTRSAGRTDGR